ncbi:hypothetical protein [Microlunatus endophyticus]|nr:hypothetical protein [Microlunatus endophyticus]
MVVGAQPVVDRQILTTRACLPAVTVAAFALGYSGTVAVGQATTAGAR